MIPFAEEIIYGHLIKRYKRFFMDVVLDSGEEVTAHTPNTGSMLGLLTPSCRVMLTKSRDPARKTAFTAQALLASDSWVGINTYLPNRLIRNSLAHPLLSNLSPYGQIKAEVAYGQDMRSRIDFYFDQSVCGEPPLYLEIKNVTLKIGDRAQFPDAISTRAQKHLADLLYMKRKGYRAALYFVVQRQDCSAFSPAEAIDQTYAKMLAEAHEHGLLIRALAARMDETGLRLTHELPVILI